MPSRRLVVIAACLVALFMFLFAQAVNAETLIARQGDDMVVMFDKPCTHQMVLQHPMLQTMEPEAHKEYRAAVTRFSGQTYNACWRHMGNAVHLLYEDGDQGIIPKREIRVVQDV